MEFSLKRVLYLLSVLVLFILCSPSSSWATQYLATIISEIPITQKINDTNDEIHRLRDLIRGAQAEVDKAQENIKNACLGTNISCAVASALTSPLGGWGGVVVGGIGLAGIEKLKEELRGKESYLKSLTDRLSTAEAQRIQLGVLAYDNHIILENFPKIYLEADNNLYLDSSNTFTLVVNLLLTPFGIKAPSSQYKWMMWQLNHTFNEHYKQAIIDTQEQLKETSSKIDQRGLELQLKLNISRLYLTPESIENLRQLILKLQEEYIKNQGS